MSLAQPDSTSPVHHKLVKHDLHGATGSSERHTEEHHGTVHHGRLHTQAVDLLTQPGHHHSILVASSHRVVDHGHLVMSPLAATDRSRTAAGGGTDGDHALQAKTAAMEAKLDPRKSVSDLVKTGVIHDGSEHVNAHDYAPLKAGETPRIHVVYQNTDSHSHTPQPKPNFIVDKHGAITALHNPEGSPPDREVVIQVQRDRGNAGKPAPEQQASIDALVNYEGSRIIAHHGAKLQDVQTLHGPVKQVPITDDQGLVSDRMHQQLGDRLPPDALPAGSRQNPTYVPRDVQDTSDRINRVRGSHGHTMIPRESAPGRPEGDPRSPAGYDQMIPPRQAPVPSSELPSVSAFKDALAAMFHADYNDPSHTIREAPGIGYRVGRYGMNQGFTMMGVAEMLHVDLGNPPDMSKLQDYLAQHPDAMQNAMHQYAERLRAGAVTTLPDGTQTSPDQQLEQAADQLDRMAADPNFQPGFVKLLGDMNGSGDPVTAQRLDQFMPKELQEALAEGAITHLAKSMQINPSRISEQDAGRLALGAALGRTPTDADLAQYRGFTNAAGNMSDLTNAGRQHGGNINVNDNNGRISASAEELADNAERVARSMGTIGKCSLGLGRAIDMTLGQVAGHDNAWDYGRNLANCGKFHVVGSLNQLGNGGLRKGDIVVRSWNADVIAQHHGQNWGDVAVVTGRNSNGSVEIANDHTQTLSADGGRFRDSYVLRLNS
jgi:hypothetical protein